MHVTSFNYFRLTNKARSLFPGPKNSMFRVSTLYIFNFSTSNELRKMFVDEAYFYKIYHFYDVGNLLRFFYSENICSSFPCIIKVIRKCQINK